MKIYFITLDGLNTWKVEHRNLLETLEIMNMVLIVYWREICSIIGPTIASKICLLFLLFKKHILIDIRPIAFLVEKQPRYQTLDPPWNM